MTDNTPFQVISLRTMYSSDQADLCHGGQGNNTIDTCETIKPMNEEEDLDDDMEE